MKGLPDGVRVIRHTDIFIALVKCITGYVVQLSLTIWVVMSPLAFLTICLYPKFLGAASALQQDITALTKIAIAKKF